MPSLKKPDRRQLESWLNESNVDFTLCSDCNGLHISALQALEGVVDARLLQEQEGLLFSTGLEVRPMALLPLSADIHRMNIEHPNLKIFLDIVDDATPQLIIASYLAISAGLSREQFSIFVVMTLNSTRQLANECLQMDYLFPEADSSEAGPSHALH
ncbi:YbjN domain-containing protein [Parahaliea sp. F7430]|uniref:YbjN domain-containing protein n=1 Tax=Sediminihaliea albiluteola TaxID=2758564 RepID=A0A7W2TWB8_9GAMM|nr:YbjN domain-containing protein [Sediminihaliea albiluteola]MBA6413140.1 YbjN domain-containing protein [Sediminihaliea albiluteola]